MSHTSVQPARMKAARVAVAGLATAAVSAGLAVTTAGTANASTGGGSVWDRVAACESGGNWSTNTGNGFYGGLQFTQSTWRAYGGSGSPQHASRAQQIAVAQRVLAGQGPGAWPVCSRKAGLGRSNGGSATSYRSTSSQSTQGVTSSRSSHRRHLSSTSTTSAATTTSSTSASAATRDSGTTRRHSARTSVTVRANETGPRSSVAHGLRSEVRTIQRQLGVGVDGVIGPVTARAIQKYVGVAQDGVVGPVTVAAIEKKLGLSASGAHRLTPSRIEALANALA